MKISFTQYGTKLPWHLAIVCFLACSTSSFAQLNIGGVPQSFSQPAPTQFAPDIATPGIDLTALQAEDLIRDNTNVPYRIAVGFQVTNSLENSGTWEILANGDRVWRLNVVCKGAVSTNFIFSDFYMPNGAVFYIYNGDRSQVLGGYTAQNNRESGTFATQLLAGESATLEYYEPAAVNGQGIIQLQQIAHGYRGMIEPDNANQEGLGDSGACQVDVNCSPEGDGTWQTIKKSVARILINGSGLCSGTLLNTTSEYCSPYFMTAHHCIDGTFDAISSPDANIVFYWNFERSGCNDSSAAPLNQTTSGALVVANTGSIASANGSDFALLRLTESPIGTYLVYMAGWDATGATGVGGKGIHHPRGDAKKIATHTSTPASVVNDHYWRIYWDATLNGQSVTEGGSSGSGLFNSTGIFIGQLFGGFDGGQPNCSDPAADEGDYGKLSYSWTSDNQYDQRRKVHAWLDPVGEGTTTSVAGRDPSAASGCSIQPIFGRCYDPQLLSCEQSVTINTATQGFQMFSKYDQLTGSPSWTGNEYIMRYIPLVSQSFSFNLTNNSVNADMGILLFEDGNICTPMDHLLSTVDDNGDGGNEQLTYSFTAGLTYYIIVDVKAGQTGTFTLEVGEPCPIIPDVCTNPEITFCDNTVSSTTTGASTDFSAYNGINFSLTGPERVYAINLAPGNLTATLNITTAGQDLDLILMGTCDPTVPILASSATTNATEIINYNVITAGTYYLVVEGYQGANSPFTLQTICNSTVLAPRVLLQGSYNAGSMNTDLAPSGLIPLLEPYTASGYVHVDLGGGETTTTAIINDNNIVDWVIVELRTGANAASATTIVASVAALVNSNGDVVDHRDGVTPISFAIDDADQHFIAIKHRNHLGIMTNIRY